MKFLCLVYFEASAFDALTKEEHDALTRASLQYDKDLQKSGHLIAAEALQSPAAAVTVRVRNGKQSATDGPFAETTEQLAGFILIEAKDHAEAIQVGSKIPLAKIGSIEVRPIYNIPQPSDL